MRLPEAYFIWFANKGYPKGELGRMMQIAYEMKVNGLDHLLDPLVTRPSNTRH